jgi:hypothetical protein
MATTKPTFAKMGLKMDTSVKVITIGEQEIEVRQYLPISDKLDLIARVLEQAADDNNFSNPIKLEVFTNLEIIFVYTNISFTDKQKEDLVKLYDILESNDIFNTVISAIPKMEYKSIIEGVEECSEAIYSYRNSVMGIIETISQDYSQLDMDATALQAKIGNPENLALLKDILTQMG